MNKKRIYILAASFLLISHAFPQQRQTISYKGTLSSEARRIKQTKLGIVLSILKNSETAPSIYEESHTATTDTNGMYHIEIGGGIKISGEYDSIIWSDGSYFIKLGVDTLGGTDYKMTHSMLMRLPTELTNDHIQGTEQAATTPEWGMVRFPNTRNKRPKKITVDLTTSYINKSYPADTYPIYRHYEWCDPDRNGEGNSFMISYSDNTNNAFVENTTKLGEVRLHAVPFQELLVHSANNEISVFITEPVPVEDHGRTFEIKGPWKFIYFIEW